MNATTLPPSEISSLTDSQQIILSLLPLPPTLLSVTCSSIIIFLVTRARFDTPYRRILFALSISDIITSTSFALQAFLLPSDTSQRVWAFGNDATCTFLGFSAQLTLSNVLYNGMLSFYFLLTIRYGMKEDYFAGHYERWMHSICVVFPIVTAVAGASMGVFHEVELGSGCWYKHWPEGCIEDTGECRADYVAWAFNGIYIVFVLIALVYNNIVIYYFVRKQMKKATRISMNAEIQTKRIRAVAVQNFLYVGAYFGTFIWVVVLRIMESRSFDAENEADLYPLLVIQGIVMPSTGIFNLCIYLRPRYLRVRKKFPLETRYWAVRRALYGESVRESSIIGPNVTERGFVRTVSGIAPRTTKLTMMSTLSRGDLQNNVQCPEQSNENNPVNGTD